MKSLLLLTTFTISLASGCVAEPQPSHQSSTIGFDGFGAVKVGMTIQQAERVLGHSLFKDGETYDCVFFKPKGGPDGLSFTVKDGRIRIVEVRDNKAIMTQSGIRVGSSLAEVRRAFNKYLLRELDHDGRQIIYVQKTRSKQNTAEIVFSIFNGKVVEIAAGDFSGMGSIERCS